MNKPAPSGPKWRRRAEARPDEILAAALAEFTARGFDAARMEDIARRAGISKAGVYLYFDSKEALLKALILDRMAPVTDRAKALAGASDPAAALRVLGAAVAGLMRDPEFFAVPRLVIGLSARFPAIAEHYRDQVVRVARGALETLIARGVKMGQFRPVDTDAVVRAFIGPLVFEALWTHVLRGESALDDPAALIEAQFDLILNGLAPAPQDPQTSETRA